MIIQMGSIPKEIIASEIDSYEDMNKSVFEIMRLPSIRIRFSSTTVQLRFLCSGNSDLTLFQKLLSNTLLV